jgi:hypothetical protein
VSIRRQRRRDEKERRHASRQVRVRSGGLVQLAERVERLAYTRKQAAEALGVSIATLDRRVVPAIATVRTEWGTRLIPVDELERFLDERRHEARVVHSQPARRGRKPGIALEVVARIRNEHAAGQSLGEIAAPAQRRWCQDRAGRPTVVALDGASRSQPPKSARQR